jgi:hypothetical protein
VTTLAIFVLRSRIISVSCSSLRVLLLNTDRKHTTEKDGPGLENLISSQGVVPSQSAGVSTPISGGMSDTLHTMLVSSGFSMITRIAGSAGEILAAFVADAFDSPRFCMPRRGGRHNGGLAGGPKGPFALQQGNPQRFTAQPSQTIKGVMPLA